MKNFFILLGLFLFSILLYVLTVRGSYDIPLTQIKIAGYDKATKPFELSPERDRYLLTETLAEYKTFEIPKNIAFANPSDLGYYNGRFFILFAPGISLLAVPLFLLGYPLHLAQVFSFFTIAIFASLTMLFMYLISKKVFQLSSGSALFGAIIFGFATSSWNYAITLYQHHVTLFFIFSGFYAAWRYRQNYTFSFLWGAYVWVAFGLSIFLDYPNFLLMLPVIIYFFFSAWNIHKTENGTKFSFRISYIISAVLFVSIMFIHGYYNYKNFGSPTRVSQSLVNYQTIQDKHLLSKKNGKETIQALQQKKAPVQFFSEESFPHGIYILLLGVERGIFFYAPILLLSLYGIYTTLRKYKFEATTLISIVTINIFLYSSFGDPWGGWAFGPRYLIPTIGILSLFCASAIFSIKNIFIKIGIFILFAYSCAIALLGALTTNQVPPQVEAIPLHVSYTFMRNFELFQQGRTSSFLYATYFSNFLSLPFYYAVIFLFILLTGGVILFCFTGEKKYDN